MTKHPIARLASIAGLLSLAASAAWAGEPLNLKPGLWEMSTNTALNGSMIPPALLAQMPPEQRARMEAALKQQSGAAHAHSTRSCITKEYLQRGSVHTDKDEDHEHCQYRVVTQTPTNMETHFQCTGEGARDGEMKMEVVNPEQFKGALRVSTPNGKVTMQITGHWVGASCAAEKN